MEAKITGNEVQFNSVERELRSAESELLKKNLILEQLDTFLVEYNFKTKELYIDPVKEKFISVPWKKKDIIEKLNYEELIFRPDIFTAKEFLDFSNVRPESKKRSITIRLFTEPHKYKWFRITQMCFFDKEKNIDKVVISFTNTDEKTEMEQSLKFHSEKDPLTHLPNINAFQRKVMELIHSNIGDRYEMIRMDVEGFRIINEMFGSDEGDKLLKFIGVRIQECLDEEEMVAYCRTASDVFLMCVPVRLYSINGIIEYLKRAVAAYPRMYEVQLSFGVYYITREDVEQMIPVTRFIDRAASAQNTIKGNYLHHVAYYNESIERQEKNEHRIISDMQSALEEEQFEVYLQPKVDMNTGKIVGSEALSRWIHPKRGVIMPGEYVPIFEKNGFIVALDEYIIKHTCKIIRKWIDEKVAVYPISVNLSRTNLYNPKLLSRIEEYVSAYDVPRDKIEFELTESGFATDNNHLSSLSRNLQKRGFKVYMDDFGSGYSSLNALREISVNILKIDLRFLPTRRNDEKANTILKYVVKMAEDLDMDIVVEGVENQDQRDFLLSIGCTVAQGFYYYKPMSVEQYEKQITEDR